MNTMIFLLMTILAVAFYARRQQLKYAEIKFRNNLFKIRDELRRLAIEKKVNCKDEEFEYLDETLSITIFQSYYLTLFRLLYLSVLNRNNIKIERLHEDLLKKIDSNNNYKEIKKKLEASIIYYIAHQHLVSIVFLVMPAMKTASHFKKVKRKIKTLSSDSIFWPQTSFMRHSL